jgi:DNA primase
MTGTAIVVEGYTDVIALHEAGITNAVATLGTALSARHVRILARFAKRVVYLFDGDEAGQRAADRASGFLDLQATPEASEGKVDFRVAVIPGSADPADYVGVEGADALRKLVDEAPPLLRFLLDRRLSEGDPSTPEGRAVALRAAAGVLAGLRGSILAHDYIEYVAGRLLVDYDTVEAAIRDTTARVQVGTGSADDTRPEGKPRTRLDMEALVELEVLALASRYPSVRPEARDLLAEGLVTDPERAALLSSIIDAGDATGAELVSAIEARRPGSAEVLSAASVDEPTRDQAGPLFAELAGRLREIGLRRRISALQARMRTLDPRQDRHEYDQAFAEAAELRKRLERERIELESSDTTEA